MRRNHDKLRRFGGTPHIFDFHGGAPTAAFPLLLSSLCQTRLVRTQVSRWFILQQQGQGMQLRPGRVQKNEACSADVLPALHASACCASS